jgi:hypothetical protein
MAIHDEIFYQMAADEGITLTDEEEERAQMTLTDFWADLTDRGGEQLLGMEEEEFADTVEHIALAEKYQDLYATINGKTYEDYAFTADAYTKLLEEQDYTINEEVWGKVGIGTVTLEF